MSYTVINLLEVKAAGPCSNLMIRLLEHLSLASQTYDVIVLLLFFLEGTVFVLKDVDSCGFFFRKRGLILSEMLWYMERSKNLENNIS